MTVPASVTVTRPAERSSARWCLMVGLDSSKTCAISVRVKNPGHAAAAGCAGACRHPGPGATGRPKGAARAGRPGIQRGVGDGVAEQAPISAPKQEVVWAGEVRRARIHPPDAGLRQPADAAGRLLDELDGSSVARLVRPCAMPRRAGSSRRRGPRWPGTSAAMRRGPRPPVRSPTVGPGRPGEPILLGLAVLAADVLHHGVDRSVVTGDARARRSLAGLGRAGPHRGLAARSPRQA